MKDIYIKYLKRGVINTHQFSVLTWYNARFYDMKWCDMILYNITWYLLDFIPLNWSGAWQSLSLKRYDMTQTFANYDMTSRDIRWYNGLTLYNIIWHYIILYFTARFQVKCRSPYLICMHFITHFSTFCYLQSSYFDNIWQCFSFPPQYLFVRQLALIQFSNVCCYRIQWISRISGRLQCPGSKLQRHMALF